MQQATSPGDELDPEGSIQTQLGALSLDVGLGDDAAFAAQVQHRDVAWRDAQQQEGRHGHPEKRGHH